MEGNGANRRIVLLSTFTPIQFCPRDSKADKSKCSIWSDVVAGGDGFSGRRRNRGIDPSSRSHGGKAARERDEDYFVRGGRPLSPRQRVALRRWRVHSEPAEPALYKSTQPAMLFRSSSLARTRRAALYGAGGACVPSQFAATLGSVDYALARSRRANHACKQGRHV